MSAADPERSGSTDPERHTARAAAAPPPVAEPGTPDSRSGAERCAFDAVLFDLDGTLVATDRYWIPAARAGARRAFAELGIAREGPSAEAWMSLVGEPLARGIARLFPELDAAQRALVQERCVEEEHALLRDGRAALMPGAAETLARLAESGARLGVASNCSQSYLEIVLGGLGLERWIEEARCLDSPGVLDKADMIADLLLAFDTRSAVFVGDRRGDRDAARANALPHVHYAGGFAQAGEELAAEALLLDLRELPALLDGRARAIRAALDGLGALRAVPPRAIGITGAPASGKTLFARDAERVLARAGVRARAVSLESYRLPGRDAAGEGDPLGAYDVARLAAELLGPHAAGKPARLPRESPGVQAAGDGAELVLEPGDVLLLEGTWLADARLATRLDRLLALAVPEAVSLARLAAREGSGAGPAALERLHAGALPAWRAFAARHPLEALADRVLAASNPLLPVAVARTGA